MTWWEIFIVVYLAFAIGVGVWLAWESEHAPLVDENEREIRPVPDHVPDDWKMTP